MIGGADGRFFEKASRRQEVCSLLELLRFYAHRFVLATTYLHDVSNDLDSNRKDPGRADNEPVCVLQYLKQLCDEVELSNCSLQIQELLALAETGTEITSSALLGASENVQRELRLKVFLSLQKSRGEWFSKPLEGWEKVLAEFPNAQTDIEEMNKCFALSRYSAAVFHSLLVVEHGLISLGKKIGVADPRTGWDATYNRLGALLKDRKGVPENIDFGLMEQVKSRLDSMKLAWRNKVNHAAGRLAIEKTGFTEVSAEEVIVACRSFMRFMAEEIDPVS